MTTSANDESCYELDGPTGGEGINRHGPADWGDASSAAANTERPDRYYNYRSRYNYYDYDYCSGDRGSFVGFDASRGLPPSPQRFVEAIGLSSTQA